MKKDLWPLAGSHALITGAIIKRTTPMPNRIAAAFYGDRP
jgi:hypothetical protein